MPPLRLLITHNFTREQLDEIKAVSPRIEIDFHPIRREEELPADVVARAEVLYTGRNLPSPDAAPKLKWVQCHFAGVDMLAGHALLKTGVQLTTLSGVHATPMAEYTLMLMLAFAHRLPRLLDVQRRGEWPSDRWEKFGAVELRGATAGIIGYGSIGREIARLACAFGMDVLATKKDAMHPADTGWIPAGQGDPGGDLLKRLYPPQALRSMLAECDYVVMTAPLTPDTRNMLGEAEFNAMKNSAVFINVSRGEVVDEPALIAALRSGEIAGAALDVFAVEPLPAESPLWKLPNVILSPHISGVSSGYDQRAVELFCENLRRYISGEGLLNLFEREKGY